MSETVEKGDKVEYFKLNPYLKNLFFEGFRDGEQYKAVERELGEGADISIIIKNGKAVLRASKNEQKEDIDFTKKEYEVFLKRFRVKQETLDACKFIIITIDMEKKTLHITQHRKDGTKKHIIV